MSAILDVRSDLQAVTSGAYLEAKPTGTEEWGIHNIYSPETSLILRYFDGTKAIDFVTQAGPFLNVQFHVNATRWLRIVNNDGATQNIGYDGVLTHT